MVIYDCSGRPDQANTRFTIRGPGNFSVRGSGQKNLWGDVVGDPNVQSTIREGNFFSVFLKIFKNQERNYKFQLQGDMGRDAR